MDLKRIKDHLGLQSIAIIRRDGEIQDHLLPDALNKETFAIMCATIYGAAITGINELHYRPPKHILIESESGWILLQPYKERYFVVALSSLDHDINEIISYIASKASE